MLIIAYSLKKFKGNFFYILKISINLKKTHKYIKGYTRCLELNTCTGTKPISKSTYGLISLLVCDAKSQFGIIEMCCEHKQL